MKPIDFDYYAPDSLPEALEVLDQLGYDGKVLAGGQSLIAAMNFRMARPPALVDINKIKDMDFIRVEEDGSLVIGAITRVGDVERSEVVKKAAPIIIECMPYIAHAQIRNRGTFGGAIAHADPAGQLPGVVMALDAKVLVKKKGNERWLESSDLFMGPFMTFLDPEELLVEVVIPAQPERTGMCYMQMARQQGAQFQVAVSTVLSLDKKGRCEKANVVLMGVGEMPILAQETTAALVGKELTDDVIAAAAEIAANKEADPGEDIHATISYRRHLVKVLVERTVKEAAKRAAGRGG